MWQAFYDWRRQINRALAPHNLTQLQFSLLACLSWMLRTKARVSQQQLADFASIDKMQVSQVLHKLEHAGFIHRVADESDRRAKYLEPTDAGQETLARAIVDVDAADEAFFGRAQRAESLRMLLDRLE